MASTLIRICSKSTSVCRRIVAQPQWVRGYAEAAAAPVAQAGQMVFTFAAPEEVPMCSICCLCLKVQSLM